VTLEQDRAEIERVAVSWQDVPEPEQEAMLASLGKMLEYLDPAKTPSTNSGWMPSA